MRGIGHGRAEDVRTHEEHHAHQHRPRRYRSHRPRGGRRPQPGRRHARRRGDTQLHLHEPGTCRPPAVLTGVKPEVLVGTGCNVPTYGASFAKGTVSGQVVGWANPRSFSYTSSLCPLGLQTFNFNNPTLLPKN